MIISHASPQPGLTLFFDLTPERAARLRVLPMLKRLTVGRAQTRAAATGDGFRSHRRLQLDPTTSVDLLLALEPGTADSPNDGLAARLRLTLIEGAVEPFVEFILGLCSAVPMRLSPRQDAASVQPCEWSDIDPDDSTDAALAAVLRGCQTQLSALHASVAEDGAAEGVHQTRVGLRRLRAALGLFKPILPPEFSARLNEEARWLGERLAPVRDWDVFTTETLAPFRKALPGASGLAELTARAQAARDRAALDMTTALNSGRCFGFFLNLEIAIERRVWRHQQVTSETAQLFNPLSVVAPLLLDRLWRAARRQAKALSDGDSAASHELRKKIKKLRYSVEFIQSVGEKRDVKAFLAELALMQQKLGVANDAVVAEGLIAQLVAGKPQSELDHVCGFIAGWQAHARLNAPPDAKEGWRRLRAAPKFWRVRDGAA